MTQCYAPTNDAQDEDKENFNKQLGGIFSKVPNLEVYLVKFPHAVWVCIAMGSFNAKVGTITKIGKRGGNMALYRDEQQWQKAYTNMQ